MKKIALIGSTGSIGRQVIEVVKLNPDKFEIVALVAHSSYELFLRQLNELHPAYAALTDKSAAEKLGEIPQDAVLFSGEGSGVKALEECGADICLVAASGFAGLEYSFAAAERKIPLALANKETLVCAGDIIMPLLKDLRPVDSEHSAIWQCLNFNLNAPFEKLVITASGGAFRGKAFFDLKDVTPEQALCHPTWSMGAKITIDSATLLNKGYEVIEAHHLYNAPYERIKTVIHPQSIVHSLVQLKGGATLAHLSYPDMKLPISLALSYPERVECGLAEMDFTKAFSLEFLPLIRKDYPLYDLALSCGEEGGVLPTVLNAAAEEATHAFLQRKIRFTDIYSVAAGAVEETKNKRAESYPDIKETDICARARATELIKRYNVF